MDSATCNVIYVDRHVRDDTLLGESSAASVVSAALGEYGELQCNLKLLLDAFGEVHVCATGASCVSKLFELHDNSLVELKPTLVLIDTPHDEQIVKSASPSRDPSPHSRVSDSAAAAEVLVDEGRYGLSLLERIVYEAHSRNLSKLVVPINVVTFPLLQSPPATNDGLNDDPAQTAYARYLAEAPDPSSSLMTNRGLVRKCLDSGAIDVMASPLHMKTLTTLEVHAYRAHKEAVKDQQALLDIKRGRKRSWVGVHDEKPFSYLREAMVSGLMSCICRTDGENYAGIANVKIYVSAEDKAQIARAIGKWHFNAHTFCDDQLLVAASLMFRHALSMPELEDWRIPSDQLTAFLVACRAAYNTFVPYHNFRHAVDVLQATFNFLVQIGALPPYPAKSGVDVTTTPKSPLAALLKPFEALTLLISAIGHDVGHPGVNNGFLVTINAPLAQLYNDRSVLESFHCAAYSQILRRYWPNAFDDVKMRALMISSILATDMGMHFDYMTKLGSLQERLHENNSTDGWNGRVLDAETALACALLIKCADISNVARQHEAAVKWMYILCDEFSRQAGMEEEIGIETSLIAEPKKDFLPLAKAQLGFMNMFAIPLFQGVADILPAMQYTVDELDSNRIRFEQSIEDFPGMDEERRKRLEDGALSPRSRSTDGTPGGSRDSSSSKTLEPPRQSIPDNHAEMKQAGSSHPDESSHITSLPLREVNGLYNSEAFAASDSFNANDVDSRAGQNGKQRHSETTEGSNSLPCNGDWASQATSATTGKMPLSPSTQGTSIISQESVERPVSGQASYTTAPETNHLVVPAIPPYDRGNSDGDFSNEGPPKEAPLKKKPSKFKMGLDKVQFWKRPKSSPSPSNSGESLG